MADPPDKAKPAPKVHVVKEHERMSSIADLYGFKDYHALYMAQTQEFRDKRPNPEILMPGDNITLVEKVDAKLPAKDKTKLKYEDDTALPEIRIHLQIGGKPFAKKDLTIVYQLPHAPGGMYAGKVTTDDKGIAKFKIDPRVAWMYLYSDKPKVRFALDLGTLRPAAEAGGVEQRLDNLGYRVRVGPIGASVGPAAKEAQERLVKKAVQRFQEDHSQYPNGKVDAAFRAALVKAHEP
jgi:hypothetical protein